MAIATQCANGFVWALGLLARVFAGLVSMGHLAMVVAILLFGCVATILLMRLYDSNISFWTPIYGGSLAGADQPALPPPSELANPALLREVMAEAKEGKPPPQQLLDTMPQQAIERNAAQQIERLALENGRLQAQLQNASSGQQLRLRNQINSQEQEQRNILQLPPSQQTQSPSLQLQDIGGTVETKSGGNNNKNKKKTLGGRRRRRRKKSHRKRKRYGKKKRKTKRRKRKTKKRRR
jgi:hypothetical protein